MPLIITSLFSMSSGIFSSISFVVIMLLFDYKVTKNKCKNQHLCSVISALVPCNLCTYVVGSRSPSNRVASAVRSDCVRCTMKECGVEYIRSATSTVFFLSIWAARRCPLRGTGSRRWPSRALLRGWLLRHRVDSRRNKGETSVRLRRCRRAWG